MTDAQYTQKAAAAAVRRLIDLLKIEKRGLWVVFVYAAGIGLMSLAAPIGVQMLVNAIAFGGLIQPIIVLSVLVLVALFIAAVLRAAQAWVVERIQQRLFVRVACDLGERLTRVSITAFDEDHGPEIVNRFFDVLTLQKGAAMLLLDGILVTLQVLVGGVLLALYHPTLLGFALAVLMAGIIVIMGMGRRGAPTSIDESKAKYALVAWFEEMARHPTIFRDANGARFATERSMQLTQKYVDKRHQHFRIVFRQTSAFLGIQALATAALLGIGGGLVLSGQLTLGQLVAAELILTGVVAGFAKFGKYLESYYDLIAAVDKLGYLVDLPLERQADGSLSAERGPVGITLNNVTYTYPSSEYSFAPLSADIPPRARVAITGPNGSGKSTLIDLMFGLRDPISGSIELGGLPLRDLSLARVREQLSLVRGAGIFEGTIYENVCMGRTAISLEDVKAALEAVGLWQEIRQWPNGLETIVATHACNLSRGQAQRIALARAIAAKPGCLLLDEALDDLDPDARHAILSRVLSPRAPWTVVVASHDPAVVAACSHKIELGSHRAKVSA